MDVTELQRFLLRVARRLRWLTVARGVAAGLLVALTAVLVAWVWHGFADHAFRNMAAVAAIAGASGGALVALLALRRMPPAAVVVERMAPGSRNLIITAAELLEAPEGTRPYVRDAVVRAASAAVARLQPQSLLPATTPALLLGGAAAAWAAAWLLMVSSPAALPAILPAAGAQARLAGVEVVVIPPSYVRADSVRLRNPERVEVLAGSTLRVTAHAVADAVMLETLDGTRLMTAGQGRAFTAELRVDADGFIALQARGADAEPGARLLFGVAVTPDHPPRVQISAPGRDLILPDAQTTLELEVEAEDDHGVAALSLRYTHVTGFGEQFTFNDGSVPLQITRGDRRWTGSARWPLHGMALEPGDLLVYRAVASDHNPGAAPAESDTWVVEIGAGHVAAAGGYTGDAELDRYALSQQMVIVLTERVIARRAALSADDLRAEALTLAAAQRRVRAEFVFMLGGELADEHDHDEDDMMELHEEAHIRADADILEGRLANQGRMDLVRAIRAMSHAVTFLNDADLDEALRAEQTALVFLQRAFSRSRYILRALTERESIDLSRRLTGSLTGAATANRPRMEAAGDSILRELRRVIGEAAALGASSAGGQQTAERAAALAAAVLRIDPAEPALQQAATLLASAATAATGGRPVDARLSLEQATAALTQHARSRLRDAPATPSGPLRLEGALVEALRDGTQD